MRNQLTYADMLEPVRDQMQDVETVMYGALNGAEEPVRSVLLRSLRGGKRVRPALVMLVGRALDLPDQPSAVLAGSIEMIHAATLIHDDVLDQAPTRRSTEACHVTWPVNATILAGDLLLSKAVSLAASLERPGILRVLAEAFCTICAGEIAQMFGPNATESYREVYYRTIEAKTASLYSAACESAGILADLEQDSLGALRRYGREFGIAYQIADDVQDFLGHLADLGKPCQSDLARGSVTLPTILYLENGGDRHLIESVLRGPLTSPGLRAAIKEINSSNAIDDALAEAHAHAKKAQGALAPLPDNLYKQALLGLAKWAAVRSS